MQFEVGDAEADDHTTTRASTSSRRRAASCSRPTTQAVAGELARVTKPGGRLALACWTPEGGLRPDVRDDAPVPAAAAARASAARSRGATEDHVRELLGDAFDLELEEHDSILRTADGEEYWELFSTSYGPTKTAAEALDDERREEFHQTWVEFFEARREGDEVVHHREYLLTLGTRR